MTPWAARTTIRGVFRGDGGALEQIAREGQAAPDGNGVFSLLFGSHIAAGGQVAFIATLAGTSGGGLDDEGIYLADAQEMIRVARRGQALAGSTIANLALASSQDRGGQSPLNDFGQVAYWALLADLRQGLFVTTPELHWRNGVGGSWDDGDNWTVGLDPGAPHPVVIDPNNSLTVTGPTGGPTNIHALTIGALNGTATLRTNGGGDLTIADDLTITNRGFLDHEQGTLTAGNIFNAGSLNQDGGTLATAPGGVLTNTGTLTQGSGGVINVGSFVNTNFASIQGTLTTGLTSFTNNGNFTLLGGTLNGGPVTNDFGALMSARGTIGDAFNNNGTLNVTGFLAVTGATLNLGDIFVPTTANLNAQGGLTNFGLIALSSGAVTGGTLINSSSGIIRGGSAISAALTNDGGLIHANGSSPLLITDFSGGNVNGGEMRIEDGAGINVLSNFSNAGTAVLNGPNATLAGGEIINTGVIRGQGRVSNTVVNTSGVIRAEGGRLTLSSTGSDNSAAGRIETAAGTEVLFSQGLSANAGTIALDGGRFDNGSGAIVNNASGRIVGHGTFASAGLTNNGGMAFSGATSIFGGVNNAAAGLVTTTAGATTTFFDDVVNNGTAIQTDVGSTTIFLGAYSGASPLTGTGTVFMGGELLPGNSPALISVGGDLVLGSSLTTVMELGGTVRIADEYDAFDIGGTLTLGGMLDIDLIALLEGGDPFAPSAGDMFDLFIAESGIVGDFSIFDFPALSGGLFFEASIFGTGTSGEETFRLSVAQGQVAVPEPGTLVIFVFGLAGLGFMTRRRRRAPAA